MLSFKGGIKPDSHKYTKNTEVAQFPLPSSVRIYAHNDEISVNCGDIVKKGDSLTVNNLAHSSVFGNVIDVSDGFITVKVSDAEEIAVSDSVIPFSKKLSSATFEDIYNFTASKGICFGDIFLHQKLINYHGKATILLINCAETAPFLCTAYKTLSLKKKEIIYGAKIIMKALGIKKTAVTIEKADHSSVKAIKKHLEGSNIEVITLSSKYPVENTSVLKRAFLNKYTTNNKNIKAENVMIVSCQEAAALFEAFKTGLPMVNKLVTVDGDAVNSPRCLVAPIGTSVRKILDFCQYDSEITSKLIEGNPIRGKKCDPDGHISKATDAIIALSDKFSYGSASVCISCGRCRSACPIGLDPAMLLEKNSFSAKCIDCGCCAYICPARLDFSVISSGREESVHE